MKKSKKKKPGDKYGVRGFKLYKSLFFQGYFAAKGCGLFKGSFEDFLIVTIAANESKKTKFKKREKSKKNGKRK